MPIPLLMSMVASPKPPDHSRRTVPVRKRWGQHFLHDGNIVRKIIAALDIQDDDRILEVGPGRGILTRMLAETNARITAVELDPLLAAELRKQDWPRVRIVEEDFLKYNLSEWESGYKMVGNLPYNITSPVIFKLLNHPGWTRAVIMIQLEVAQRITAIPENRIYGRLSVMVQCLAKARILFSVSPSVFTPPPKVDSAVVLLEPGERHFFNQEKLEHVVRKAFSQRRKTLRNALGDVLPPELKDQFGGLRAEDLSPDDYILISTLATNT